MSYDIYIVDETGKTLQLDHGLRGGTYQVGGATEAWLNITYNYSPHFRRVLGEKGIRSIYGMDVMDSIPELAAAANALDDNVSDDYWEPTEGNARAALLNLIALAAMAGRGTWEGD